MHYLLTYRINNIPNPKIIANILSYFTKAE